MSDRSPLDEVVKLGGLALQAEDCLVRAAVQHRGKRGGLVWMQNERYHQFLVWRAILPVWHTVLERDKSCDLIVECEGEKYFFEMKNWRGNTGNDQIGAMQHDIKRLQARSNGYLLITSMNPISQTDENFNIFWKG